MALMSWISQTFTVSAGGKSLFSFLVVALTSLSIFFIPSSSVILLNSGMALGSLPTQTTLVIGSFPPYGCWDKVTAFYSACRCSIGAWKHSYDNWVSWDCWNMNKQVCKYQLYAFFSMSWTNVSKCCIWERKFSHKPSLKNLCLGTS